MKLISSSLSRGTVALVAFVLLASATVAGYGYLYVGAMISNPDSPDVAISKAFQAETVRVQLAFTESGDGTVSPVMFPGLRYVPGSVSGNGGGGITVTETNASTTAPEFAITGVDAGDNLIISEECNVATNMYSLAVSADAGTDNGASNMYEVFVDGVASGQTATFGMQTTVMVPAGAAEEITSVDVDDAACVSAGVLSSALPSYAAEPTGDLTITDINPVCTVQPDGSSEFTVTFTVTYDFADATGETILVLVNGQPQPAITPTGATGSASVGPLTFTDPAFNIPITAAFSATMDCSAGAVFDLVACTPACPGTPGSIGGNVFGDLNTDGALDGATEEGTSNVLVQVYDCDENLVCEVYTNAAGDWSCDGLSPTDSFRVEFSTPLQPFLQESFAGPNNGTSVQFAVADGSCDSDYATLDIAEYCAVTAVTNGFIACYASGTTTGNSAGTEGVVKLAIGSEGIPMAFGGTAPNPEIVATFGQVGAVWGTDFNPQTGIGYLTSLTKRYVGNAGDLGQIYQVDPVNNTFLGSFTLQGVNGLDFGSIERNQIDGDDNELADDNTTSFLDYDAVAKVGTTGYGDADLGPGGRFLWTVNLNSRTLVRIDVGDPGRIPTDGSAIPGDLVTEYTVDYPVCDGGVARPWALEFHEGRGYLGVVCDGSSNTDPNVNINLVGYVLSFDPADPVGFVTALEIPFNYPREVINSDGPMTGAWRSWFNDIAAIAEFPNTTRQQGNAFQIGFPQPIISDLAFTEDGSLTIGVMDRFSQQIGGNSVSVLRPGFTGNNSAPFDRNTLFRGISGGDILKACAINGTLVLEGGPGCTPMDNFTSNSATTTDGPSESGEFYFQDKFDNEAGNFTFHAEISLGSVEALPGTNDVLSVVYDPVDENPPNGEVRFSTQGVHYYDSQTGNFSTSNSYDNTSGFYEIVPPNGPLRKAAGLGDFRLICDEVLTEIGNYAWLDTDGDGLQDACEPPLAGLAVKLYRKDAAGGAPVLIATDTTDATGNYYFSSAGAATGDDDLNWLGTDADTAVQRTETYFVAFCGDDGYDADDDILTVDGLVLCLSPADAGQAPNDNQNDSDISELTVGADVLPAYCTEDDELLDGTNHTFDAGFKPLCPFVELEPTAPIICGSDTLTLSTIVDSVFVTEPYAYEWSTSGSGTFINANGDATTDYATAVAYVPSRADLLNESVVITLAVTDSTRPAACDDAEDTLTLTLQNVDCGDFLWNGGGE